MSEKKYTAGEAAIIGVAAPVFFAVVIAISFPLMMWGSYVAMKMWNWFPAAYLHLPPISFWMMLGCSYLVHFFKRAASYKDHTIDWKTELTGSVIAPAITLLFGYLVHLKIS